VERSQHQTQRLTRLVQDLLDAHRLHTGKFSLDVLPVQLDELVLRVAETAQAMTTSQEIRVEVTTAPVIVNGDAGRLEQALMNLVTNALTYAPQSQRIEVRLTRIGAEALAQVRDYGPGIAPSEVSHLTERFYQVMRTDSDRTARRGLGLGLFIVSEIVAGHGGRLEVRRWWTRERRSLYVCPC